MQEFTFTAWCERGSRGVGETFVDVELTEREAKKLVRYGTKSDIYYDTQIKYIRTMPNTNTT